MYEVMQNLLSGNNLSVNTKIQNKTQSSKDNNQEFDSLLSNKKLTDEQENIDDITQQTQEILVSSNIFNLLQQNDSLWNINSDNLKIAQFNDINITNNNQNDISQLTNNIKENNLIYDSDIILNSFFESDTKVGQENILNQSNIINDENYLLKTDGNLNTIKYMKIDNKEYNNQSIQQNQLNDFIKNKNLTANVSENLQHTVGNKINMNKENTVDFLSKENINKDNTSHDEKDILNQMKVSTDDNILQYSNLSNENIAQQNTNTNITLNDVNNLSDTQQLPKLNMNNTTETIQKISEYIEKSISSNIKEVEVQLNPENLGKIIIKASMEFGEASVKITCFTEQAHETISNCVNDLGLILQNRIGGETNIFVDIPNENAWNPDSQQENSNQQHKQQESKNKSQKSNNIDFESDFLQQLRLGIS